MMQEKGITNPPTKVTTYPTWHTGNPTEEGYYLVHLDGYYNQDTVGYIVAIWKNEGWRNINKGCSYNLGGVEAWQKIEPFEARI